MDLKARVQQEFSQRHYFPTKRNQRCAEILSIATKCEQKGSLVQTCEDYFLLLSLLKSNTPANLKDAILNLLEEQGDTF